MTLKCIEVIKDMAPSETFLRDVMLKDEKNGFDHLITLIKNSVSQNDKVLYFI